ncbi:hypothetical protein Enr10x_58240 [Gimesia panareensis]|uniref:DUF1559 domain-containing protein n=1 Tax=Gimesia panareensis TaxID=2527978 RepID=A0A517QFP1_9PLAN|nr:DUF1559 domain-containing protein [Gimesia panareensis]QDT30458.1 hypothetical protein Enr10x_58240 [Gimesia panareensis]
MKTQQQNRSQPAGFVLVELWCVLLVIMVLIALLLPAVQQAREAARSNVCKNNLMQLGIALQNYRMAHQVFPPGTINPQGPILNQPEGYHVSWVLQILPLLDERAAFLSYDFMKGVYDPVNSDTANYMLQCFICPSSPTGGYNYAGCQHDVEAPIDADNQGVFYLNSRIREKDLKDGRSYTIFLGETSDGGLLSWTSGTSSTLRNMGTKINQLMSTRLSPRAAYPYGNASGYQFKNDPLSAGYEGEEDWNAEGNLEGTRQKKELTPEEKKALLHVGGFSSFHAEGAHFSFGDASVRYLSQKTDYQVLKRLANRQDGNLVGEF